MGDSPFHVRPSGDIIAEVFGSQSERYAHLHLISLTYWTITQEMCMHCYRSTGWCHQCQAMPHLQRDIEGNYPCPTAKEAQMEDHYYPFKKYVEYIFTPGCLSMMSRSSLRLWLAARIIASFVFVGDRLKQFKTINTNNHKLEWLRHSFSTFLFRSSLLIILSKSM